MKFTSRLLALLMALTLLMSVSGLAETAASPADTVVATVDGTPLYLNELQEAYQYYTENGYSVTYAQILEILISTQLLREIVAENGFDQFTDEEQAAFVEQANASWENGLQGYVTNYLSEDTEEARAELRAQAEQYFRAMGYSPEMLADSLRNQEAQNRYMNSLADKDSVTREDVQNYLNNLAATEMSQIDSVYMYELYQMYMGAEFNFYPEGYRRVLHILLKVEDNLMSAYQDALAALDELNAKIPAEDAEAPAETAEAPTEAAETAEAPAEAAEAPAETAETAEAPAETTETAEAPAETAETAEAPAEAAETAEAPADGEATDAEPEKTPYEKLKTALNEMVIASKQQAIDEIETRLANGEDFAAVAKDFNEDPGEDLAVGYIVHPESIMWDPVFRDAAFSEEMAKPGDHSEPVLGSYGIHILYYMDDVPAGPVELTDERFEALQSEVLEDKQFELADQAISAKQQTADIVRETALIESLDHPVSDVQIDFEADEDEEEEPAEAEPAAEEAAEPAEAEATEAEPAETEPAAEEAAEPAEAEAAEATDGEAAETTDAEAVPAE